jgi:integrase/recombinase XerC
MSKSNFVQYLEAEKRFSAHTIKAYLLDVYQFEQFVEEAYESEMKLSDYTHKHIRAWLVELLTQGLTAKSVNRKLSSLKTYFKFWLRQGDIEINPAAKVVAPKIAKQLPAFVSAEAFDQLDTEIYDTSTWIGLRDKVVMELLYQTGIRVSELLGLKFADVGANQIKVLGKRNKERLVPITSELISLINDLAVSQQAEIGNVPWIVVGVNGKQGYPKLVYNIVHSYLSEVTTIHKKSPHVLRHTFATQMLNNGASLNSIKELLGHANLSATQVYTHNSFEKLKSIYNQAHPRA